MERIAVQSTLLAWVGYLPDQQLLELGFRSGDVYDYFAVPGDLHRQLLTADSKGGFFNQHIRNRFRTQQVYHRSAT